MSPVAMSGCVTEGAGPSVERRYRSAFAVAQIKVAVAGDEPQFADLGPQLSPFRCEPENCDIEIDVAWRPALEPCRGRELFHSGCLWSVHKYGDDLAFDFTTERLGVQPYKRLLVDGDFRCAKVVLNRQCLGAEDAGRALEYPLDELLVTHHLSLGRGVELHGCGLVTDSGAPFLFVGHSGAGKSTTARLWTRHSAVNVLSDDRIIVRRMAGPSDKVRDRQECPPDRFFMHGTPWHGEAAFASPGRAPLERIFLLEHGSGNRIERISRSAAVGELLARSFTPFYDSRFVDPVAGLLEQLTESVPCYRFQFLPDESAVEKILGFND